MNKNLNGNVFKLRALSSFEMFPSDPQGSLDDFSFETFIGWGDIVYG